MAVNRYRAASLSAGSKATYRTHLKTYVEFCQKLRILTVPISDDDLARYAAFLAEKLAFSSIQQYLNVVRLLHVENNLPNPLTNNWKLQSVMMGIKRVHGNPIKHKEPITPSLLLSVKQLLDLSQTPHAAFWAAALMMFFGLLRRSNVLCQSMSSFKPSCHLSRSDFTVYKWGVAVTVRWSKTIQCQERVLFVPLIALPKHPLCPVQALLHYFKLTPNAPLHGPAFVIPCITGGVVPLTPPDFVSRLRSCLLRLGHQPSHYAAHSFRRGGASWALQCGLAPDVVRVLGDWRSDAYLAYIDIPLSSRVKMAQTFGGKLPASV